MKESSCDGSEGSSGGFARIEFCRSVVFYMGNYDSASRPSLRQCGAFQRAFARNFDHRLAERYENNVLFLGPENKPKKKTCRLRTNQLQGKKRESATPVPAVLERLRTHWSVSVADS